MQGGASEDRMRVGRGSRSRRCSCKKVEAKGRGSRGGAGESALGALPQQFVVNPFRRANLISSLVLQFSPSTSRILCTNYPLQILSAVLLVPRMI
jgi:hypothetical protein